MTKMQIRPRFLKLPDSLFGQLLSLLFLGIVLLQAGNFSVVCNVQYLYVRQAEKSRVDNLATYWFLFNAMDVNQRQAAIERIHNSPRQKKLRTMLEIIPAKPDWRDETRGVQRVLTMLQKSLHQDFKESPLLVAHSHQNGVGIFPVHLPVLEIAMQLYDGTWLKVTQPFDVDDRKVVWSQRLLVLLEALIMLFLAAVLVQRVTKPIRTLGKAAESFGSHPELSEPLPESGVKEIRDTAQSFNRMRERICGNLAERDRMLAAMAHDLRTPLTKLQLRVSLVEPEALQQKLQHNITELGAIISQGLELARSLNSEEAFSRLELTSFVQSMADDGVDLGHNIVLDEKTLLTSVIINARPVCLKRCLENLFANAVKYGGDRIDVSIEKTAVE